MKTPFVVSLLVVGSVATIRGDIIPRDAKTPLFELYEMKLLPHKGADPHTHQMKLGKVLLSVHTLRDLRLLPDGSGVQATLNEKDTRTFSQLTHTLDFMILLCGDQKSSVVMHITGSIDDGVIRFTDASYSTNVGGYLLRRCPKSPNQSLEPTAGRSDDQL
jgi:hypothetical protein